MEIFAFTVLANLLAAIYLLQLLPRRRFKRGAGSILAYFWILLLCFPLLRLTQRNFSRDLLQWRDTAGLQEQNLRAFMATDDEQFLKDPRPGSIPVPPGAEPQLLVLLRTPELRQILPAEIRTPLPVHALGMGSPAFTQPGVPAAVASLPFLPSWGSFTPAGAHGSQGAFVSNPLQTTYPYLRFEVAGYLGTEYALRLSANSDLAGSAIHRSSELRPVRPAAERWLVQYLSVPSRNFQLNAEDADSRAWLAFREPTEVGLYSYWAGWLTRRGHVVFFFSLAVFFFGLFYRATFQKF